MSPFGALVRGVAAAAAGTAAMDSLWYWRYTREGGTSDAIAWEFASGLNDWDKAPAPAQVGRRLAGAYLGHELPAESAQLTTNVMHWGYASFWGSVYGIVVGSTRWRNPLLGLPFGAAVWGFGYAVLPLGHFYKPIWEYDAKTLWKDLSAHLVFGLTTAASFALLAKGGNDG
jgi:hypothetical protein